MKGGKREREESPKGKSPYKTAKVGTNGKSKETNKDKRPYIATIIGGGPRANLPSKGTMKRKITEMLFVHKKDGSTLVKTHDKVMLGFWNSKKVGGIPNEIFPLLITTIVEQFDISQILIDGGNSCDITYSRLFEKMGLEPYEGSYLQTFNGMTTHPWGYVKLMASVGERKDIHKVNLQFLIVACKSN